MADGFEPYHVPQQSRRDKLRGSSQPGCVDNLQGCAALLPLYDPSLISSDLMNCAAANLHRQDFSVGGANTGAAAKEEGVNLMGFVGGVNASHMFVDPQLSAQLNPNMTIQKISGSTCVYPAGIPSPQCYGGAVDQSFHGNEVVAYKPQALSAAHQDTNSNSAATNGQILSLSLSSQHGNLPLELNLQRYDSTVFNNSKVNGGCVVACNNGGSTSVDLSKSSVPLGPFTGYASVLKGSRFLKPAQQLLEELCDVGRGIYGEKSGADSSLLDSPPLEALDENGIVDDSVTYSQGVEQTRKKSKLLSMLDEVYKRYKQYYQQMQGAVAAFESVAGLSSAAPFANWALKAMSKHFICLKNAIADQLHSTSKSHSKINCDRDETQRLENSGSGTYGQRPFQNAGLGNPPIWRPQRGLPDRAVSVLRAWLFEHFLHPYPTDTDKLMLAKQTGLSRSQVSNWFINARVRLWKPMVEEIHVLETRQNQKASQREENPPNGPNDHCPVNYSIELENASTSVRRIVELPSKRTREDPTGTPGGSEGPMKLQYDNVLCNPHLGAGLSNAVGIGSGSVSLTLGLHQNGGGLPDPCPMNAARRLGLDSHGEGGYMASGFAAQSRPFGRDVVNGQFMHDFVG